MNPSAWRGESLWFAVSLSIALCFAGASCANRESDRRPASAQYRVTVMTYNLYVGNNYAVETLDAIRRGNADLVCLQEVSPRAATFLERALAEKYPYRSLRHATHASVGILSRYPIAHVAKVEWPTGWSQGLIARIAHPAETIQLLITHLKPVFVTDQFRLSFLELPRSLRTHAREIRYAWSKLDPDLPTLALGDFNEGERGPALRWLTDTQRMQHAISPFDRSATWRIGEGRWRFGTRLDHVLHSAHFVAKSARVIRAGASDHLPVVATLKRKAD